MTLGKRAGRKSGSTTELSRYIYEIITEYFSN
jgi:hypothetical protein